MANIQANLEIVEGGDGYLSGAVFTRNGVLNLFRADPNLRTLAEQVVKVQVSEEAEAIRVRSRPPSLPSLFGVVGALASTAFAAATDRVNTVFELQLKDGRRFVLKAEPHVFRALNKSVPRGRRA